MYHHIPSFEITARNCTARSTELELSNSKFKKLFKTVACRLVLGCSLGQEIHVIHVAGCFFFENRTARDVTSSEIERAARPRKRHGARDLAPCLEPATKRVNKEFTAAPEAKKHYTRRLCAPKGTEEQSLQVCRSGTELISAPPASYQPECSQRSASPVPQTGSYYTPDE